MKVWIPLITLIVTIFAFPQVYIIFTVTQITHQIVQLEARIDKRFAEGEARIDKRFAEMGERMTEMENRMDKRFNLIETRLDALNQNSPIISEEKND